MAINRDRDHVAESSEEVSMYVGREGRKQGAREGQRRLGSRHSSASITQLCEQEPALQTQRLLTI